MKPRLRQPGRLILSICALILGLAGVAAMFAPEEIEYYVAGANSPALPLAIQLAGSGLLGFAFLDWMSRGIRIGGIYGRPVAIANLVLTTTAAFALGKAAAGAPHPGLIALTAVFGALAVAFAWLAFAHDPLD